MGRGIARLAPVLLLIGIGSRPAADAPAVEEARLRDHVATLSAPEFLGRNGAAGGKKAAEYLADQFQRIGLEPLFQGSFYQNVPGREGGFRAGRNVGAACAALIRSSATNGSSFRPTMTISACATASRIPARTITPPASR